MYCINCGEQVPDGNKYCTNCGKEVTDITNNNENQVTPEKEVIATPPIMENTNTQSKPKKKINPLIIVLIVIGAVVGLFVLLLILVYFFVVKSSSQMICECSNGGITLIYNDNTIIGYTANGFTYDLDEQREFAEQMGVDEYLVQFEEWFTTTTDGKCNYKKTIENPKEKTTDTNKNTSTNTKLVGNDNYGYINIPNDWYDFKDVDGNDSLQYSYGTTFIVTMNLVDTELSAKELAENFMYNKQQSSEVEGVTGATITIGDKDQYTAYQVYMYYKQDNVYLITYWFEAEDGKVHYLALEGPGEVNDMKLTDFLSIPESFHLK